MKFGKLSGLLGSLAALLLFHACDFGSPIGGGGGTGGEGLTLTGIIVDPQGLPVAGAKVRIHPDLVLAKGMRTLPPPRPDSTVTNSAGRFRFTNVAEGRYNLDAAFNRGSMTYAVFVRGIEMRNSVDLGTTVAHETGTLLVRIRYEGYMPLEGVRCVVSDTSYVAYSDDTGLCRLNVAAGKHVVATSFGGTHPGFSDTLEVASGAINDDALIALYPSDAPLPRTTASIRFFARSEFEGAGEVGVINLTIVTGGELPCDTTEVAWDENTEVRKVEIALIGIDSAFYGVDDLEVGLKEGLRATVSSDMFYDLGRTVDLRITAILGTEVTGHYTVKAANGNVVREKLPFRAVLCPD